MRTIVFLLLLIALFATAYATESEVLNAEEQMSDSSLGNGATLKARTNVNIRAGPCTWYRIEGVLYTGQTVTFTGQVRSGCGYTWYSTNRGWIAAEFLMAVSTGGGGLAYGTTLRAKTNVNIRTGPCTWYGVEGVLYTGQAVSYTGQTRSGCGYTWYSTNRGWIAAEFLTTGNVNTGGGNTGGGGGGCRTRSYPLFKQCDGRWAWNRVGNGGTICQIGCLMSSVSMALAGLGKNLNGQSPNPGTFNAYLNAYGGYYGDEFEWGSVARFGLYYQGQPTDKATINRNVCANNVVILNVMNGAHWVLATGVAPDGTYYVNDPGFYRSTYSPGEVVRAGIFSL